MPTPPTSPRFRYDGHDLVDDAGGITLTCRYSVDGHTFAEVVGLPGASLAGPPGRRAALERAARLVNLLAGTSYYKTVAPPVVDLGDLALDDRERAFLRQVWVEGLGEFAYRNGLDLSGVRFEADAAEVSPLDAAAAGTDPDRALVPFGGGIDSIVTVESVRARTTDAALFVVNRPGDRFAAIEGAAAVTALPVVRAERRIDPQLLRSAELGFLNGHVPVTGIISAIAVLAAVAHGRGTVVMSNEWSASSGNVAVGEVTVNHQFSKSWAYEQAFAGVLEASLGDAVTWFSLLRPWSELAIAERFAGLDRYHHVFRSCNRAFHQDPAARSATWCGRCDKCCFIDLILAPHLGRAELDTVFGGREPLRDASLLPQFRTLVGLGDVKPFECVGDVDECRAAVLLAARRSDRLVGPDGADAVLGALASELGPWHPAVEAAVSRLLRPLGPHRIPAAHASDALLV